MLTGFQLGTLLSKLRTSQLVDEVALSSSSQSHDKDHFKCVRCGSGSITGAILVISATLDLC